jgi:hypothetical protein
MTRTKWAAVVALVALASCGVPPATSTAPDGIDLPLATPAVSTTESLPTDEEIACPHFRTPTSPINGADSQVDTQFAERNLGAINAYVSAHASEGGTPWLDGVNDPPQLVVGFTSNVAQHRTALAALLADPDRVLVCRVAHSQADVSAAAAEIEGSESSGSDGFLSISSGVDAVTVHLRGDRQAVADDLIARYGDLVSITLGNFPYPPSSEPTSSGAGAWCAADLTGPTDLDGLRAVLTFSEPSVHSGQDINGTVTVTNTGDSAMGFETGSPLVGSVVKPGTTTAVASYSGAIAGVGLSPMLQPGESTDIPVYIGTESCDPSLGYTLLPGQYEVLAVVVVHPPQAPGDPTVNQLVTSPATLTVVA